MHTDVDRPIFIMLIGLPGSGKSSYCKTFDQVKDYVHISSDSIREELWGDASIQEHPEIVFKTMRERTLLNLDQGKKVLYDATNLTRKDRASILSTLPGDVIKKAYIIWAPISECISRDSARTRKVGEDVIQRMIRRFQPPYFDEGFDEIEVIRNYVNWDYKAYRADMEKQMYIPHENLHHRSDTIFEHCYRARDYLIQKYNDWNFDLINAVTFHDIGKPAVKSFKNSKGEIDTQAHYYFHENVGAWLSYGLFDIPNVFIAWLIGNHMEPFHNSKYYEKQIPKYLKDILDILHECDLQADLNVEKSLVP